MRPLGVEEVVVLGGPSRTRGGEQQRIRHLGNRQLEAAVNRRPRLEPQAGGQRGGPEVAGAPGETTGCR